MRTMRPSKRGSMVWAMLACLMTLASVSSASGQTAVRAPASSTARPPTAVALTDSCEIWRLERAQLLAAYRLRLRDLNDARRDSALAVLAARARGDSLAIELRWRDWQLKAAAEDRPRWYETHDAGLIKGLAMAFLAVYAAGWLD